MVVDTSHSKSVRGTLSNPKTQQAIKSNKPTPDLGDGTSLKPVNDENNSFPSNDSAPPAGQGNVQRQNMQGRKQSGKQGEDKKEDLPHSKKVRGTLANDGGPKVNKTQLGDPASLKAERSGKTGGGMGRQTEREGQDKGGKSKL